MLKVAAGGEIASWLLGKANDACSRLEAEATYKQRETDVLLQELESRFNALKNDHEVLAVEKERLAALIASSRTSILCFQLASRV